MIRCQEDKCARQVQSTLKTDDQVHVEYTDGFGESYSPSDVIDLDTFE